MQESIRFHAKAINYTCLISLDLAQLLPTVSISLSKYAEAKTRKYTYGGEIISIEAIKLYFGWKRHVGLKVPLPDFSLATPFDWKCIMHLAINMGDFDFFNVKIGTEFPPLDFMEDEVCGLPSEAMVLYVEEYLWEIFYHESDWIKEEDRSEALEDINRCLQFDSSLIRLKSLFETVESVSRLVYKYVEPNTLITARFDLETLYKANIDMDYYNEIINEWVKFSIIDRRKIVSAYYKFTIETIGNNFYEDWTNFFNRRPVIAKMIWESMNRNELLTVTKIGSKRYNMALKLDYIQMQEYVTRFMPKTLSIDKQEKQLRADLQKARMEELIGDGYLKDVLVAEKKLNSYIKNRNKTNTKLAQTDIIQYNIRMFQRGKFRINKS